MLEREGGGNANGKWLWRLASRWVFSLFFEFQIFFCHFHTMLLRILS